MQKDVEKKSYEVENARANGVDKGGKYSVEEVKERFSVKDGTWINSLLYHVHGCRRIIVFIHGSGRNINMYKHIYEYANKHGLSIFAYDQRFHGRSGGGCRNMDIERFGVHGEDLEYILKHKFPRCRYDHIFIMCHSMGSMVTFGVEMKKGLRNLNPRIRGVVSLGTSFDIGYIPFVFGMVRKLLPLFPNFIRNKTLGQQTRGNDESIRSLKYQKIVAREEVRDYGSKTIKFCALYYNFLQDEIVPYLENIKIPVRFIHGTKDTRCPIFGMLDGFKRAQSKDKSIKVFKDYYHEILLEDDYHKVMRDAVKWIEAR